MILRLLLAACLVLPAIAHAGSLALTFDDGLDPRNNDQAAVWNAALLNALDAAKAKAILFAAGSRVDSPEGLDLVRKWGEGGHGIANHTYSHASFGSAKVTLEVFVGDAQRNQALLQSFPGWTRRLRFPYLKEGDTVAKRDGMRAWLAKNSYKTGAVSIDTSDWYYNKRFLAWKVEHAGENPLRFRDAYLAHLWNRANYYDALSTQLLKRSARHVLLLHTNAINAEFLPDVIAMFRAKGWAIINAEDAYTDDLYGLMPNTVPAGESILWSLAKEHGIGGLRYPAEDDVYEKPELDRFGL